MGALIGAAHCSGQSPSTLMEFTRDFSLRRILQADPFGPGLFGTAAFTRLASSLIRVATFEELVTPLTVACTDLQEGAAITFTDGPLLPPVVGSCLTAGVFTPMLHRGRHLIDGGYTDPVPIMPAPTGSLVVAIDPSAVPDWTVDVAPLHSWRNLQKVGKVSRQLRKATDALIYALGRERLRRREHLLVVPALGTMTFLDFDRAEWAIERGYEAMYACIPAVRRALESGEANGA
jgi:predicted acylesterase/phospholipase RssA